MTEEQLRALKGLYYEMDDLLLSLGGSLTAAAMAGVVVEVTAYDLRIAQMVVVDLLAAGLLTMTGDQRLAPSGRN